MNGRLKQIKFYLHFQELLVNGLHMFQVCTTWTFSIWIVLSLGQTFVFAPKLSWLRCILMTPFPSHTFRKLIIDLKLVHIINLKANTLTWLFEGWITLSF